MPTLIDDRSEVSLGALGFMELQQPYKYPRGMKLTPGTTLHSRIVDQVMQRARESRRVIQNREANWQKIERTLTAYVPLDDKEAKVQELDSRKPVSIVVPLTYAVLDTLLTYFDSSFLVDPMFAYSGNGPEDVLGAAILENVINMQCRHFTVGLNMHYMWRDSFVYGFGAVTPRWEVVRGKRSVKLDSTIFKMLSMAIPSGWMRTSIETVLFEGNKLENIDPYCYLPDPNFPVQDVQRGEYVGWIRRSNYPSLLAEEQYSDGEVFNTQYLKGVDGTSSLVLESTPSRDRFNSTKRAMTPVVYPIDSIYMYINLIPDDWGLTKSRTPEKWLFEVSADKVVRQARPMGLDHDMFPVAVCAPDSDGYSVCPLSKLEVTYGLQQVVDWMLSSHITNVRKALNDRIVVDPLLLNMQDLQRNTPGGIIRLRRRAWGRGVAGSYEQFKITDVTQQHVQNIPFLADLIQRTTGATDILQGIMRTSGERRSAQEARDTKVAALSRLEKAARIAAMQAHWHLQYMFASHTQQFATQEHWIKATGTLADVLQQEYGVQGQNLYVTPQDMLIDYDIVPGSYSPNSGEFAQQTIELLQLAASNPELAMKVDILRLFLHAARQSGAKSIQEFVRKGGQVQTQVMPDQQVEQQAQAGNIVPMQTTGVQ